MKIKSIYKFYCEDNELYFKVGSENKSENCKSIEMKKDHFYVEFNDGTAKSVYNVDEINWIK